ncbi:MAG: UDP-N-acetylglucosamine 1-carboxyvinyltransferase, partial [Fervidobacterium sp.]
MSLENRLMIEGGRKLKGTIIVSGAKNAALPIMAASLLSEARTILKNIPRVEDVFTLKTILEKIGAKIFFSENQMLIDTSNVNNFVMPEESKKMRA